MLTHMLSFSLEVLSDSAVNPLSASGLQPSAFLSQLPPTLAISLQPLAFLSQLPAAEPAQIGTWLVSACAVLSAAAIARQFTRKTPLEAEFLSRKEFQDFKDKDFAELRHRVDHSFQSLSDKLDGINNRLHELRAVLERVDERTENLRRDQPRPCEAVQPLRAAAAMHAWEPQIKTHASTNQKPRTTDH